MLATLSERAPVQPPQTSTAEVYGKMACALWVRDASGRLSYANPAAAELFGFHGPSYASTADSLGWTVCDGDGNPLAHEAFPSVAAFQTGEPQRQRVVGIRAEGRPLQWVLIDSMPLKDDAGRVQEVVSTAVEITEHKQAEIALRVTQERYRRMLETTREGLCLIDVHSVITFVNGRLCEMLGYEPAELLGRRSFHLFGRATSALLRRTHPPALVGRHEVPLRHKDGTTVWATVSAMAMPEGDQPSGLLAMFDDITAQKLSQERARAAADQIEQLVGDAIYTIDQRGVIRSWNNGAERLFGWRRDEALGQHISLVPPELMEAALRDIRRIVCSGETLTKETIRVARDGRRVDVLGSWSPVALEDGATGVLCILKDISQHKTAHEQLQEQAKSLVVLRERERIAMDLHDGVIQSLYGVTLSLGALRRQGAQGADAVVLDGAISQLTETIQGIRHYIYELRTGAAEDADLEAALKAQTEDVARRAGVTPRVSVQTDLRRLDPEHGHHLLYIAHEALSNVARHAQASHVAVRVVPWRSGMMLTIVDNGRGFDPRRRGRRRGDGLRNMHERAALLGATLTVDSQPGTGTTVKVQIP